VPDHFGKVLALCVLSACSTNRPSKIIPDPWAALGLPVIGLELVRPETGRDRFSADYSGCSAEQLLGRVETALVDHGYRQTCNQLEGVVRGYTRGASKLLVKVDSIGPVAVGNERGSDRLLFAVCFNGYQPGDSKRAK